MGMLVLSRREGESIVIDGPCVVTLLRIKGQQTRLGIKAAPSVRVMRQEIIQRPAKEHRDDSDSD